MIDVSSLIDQKRIAESRVLYKSGSLFLLVLFVRGYSGGEITIISYLLVIFSFVTIQLYSPKTLQIHWGLLSIMTSVIISVMVFTENNLWLYGISSVFVLLLVYDLVVITGIKREIGSRSTLNEIIRQKTLEQFQVPYVLIMFSLINLSNNWEYFLQ